MPRLLRYLVLLLLTGITAPAAAQWTGSLKLGAASTTFRGEASLDFHPRTSWGGGVGVGYEFAGGFAVMPEVLYVVKGAAAEITADAYNRLIGEEPRPGTSDVLVDLEWDIRYVEIPVLLLYRLETRSRFSPRIFAGPSLGYKLSARVHFKARESDTRFSEADESVQSRDLGFVLGAGTEIEAGSERLTIDVRAMLGRSNVREREPPLRNAGFALFVGLLF